MEKRQYSIEIEASRQKVWDALWIDENYREWTAAFAPGSKAVTDWKKGSKVYFLDDQDMGMFSVIEENIPTEYMSIKHLGVVKEGIEQPATGAENEWGEGHENYTLLEQQGKTKLVVDMEAGTIPKEYLEHFDKIWPIALGNLKSIAEKS